MDEQQASSAAKNLADIELIVHAGTWATRYPSQTCFWSSGLYALLGVEPSSAPPSHDALMLFVHPDDRKAVADAFTSSMLDREPVEVIHRLQLPDGRTRVVLQRASISYGDDGRPAEVTGILIDITSQQLTRQKLDETTAKLMAVWEHVPQGLLLIDSATGIVVDANPCSVATLGWPQAKIVGQTFALLFSPERVERARALFARSSAEPLRNIETEVLTESADRLPIEVSTSGLFRVGENELTLASFHDISGRKRHERARARVTDTMAAMVRANAAIVRATSRDDLLRGVCEAIVGGPFCAAWVGEADANERDRVTVVARAGRAAKYIDNSVIREGPFAQSLRTVVVCKVTDPWFAPWRERALSFGIQASLTFPIPYKERFPVFTIYLDDAAGFSSDEIPLFASLADDITLALHWLEAEDLRAQTEVRERARVRD
ncbi:MAG: PAS domain-containing protein, partial [Vulcanimicrobiaceae bacterium]